jgi:hypothetical protein
MSHVLREYQVVQGSHAHVRFASPFPKGEDEGEGLSCNPLPETRAQIAQCDWPRFCR